MSQNRPLAVLITNLTLGGRTGTEIATRNLGLWLARRGHRPSVYSPLLGPVADEIRAAGIPVTDNIAAAAGTFDIIHGQHSPTTAAAIARFPETPAVFYCRDFVAWHDDPPRLPAIRRYLSVSEATYDRLVYGAGVPPERASILLNAVDTESFLPGPTLPKVPRRALVMAKGRNYVPAIENACARAGIVLDTAGSSVGRLLDRPEAVMPLYDLVFASDRTAMEAVACGRAVIVCDHRGLAGMCTTQCFDVFRRANFGLRIQTRPCSADAVYDELRRYDPVDAAACSLRMRSEAGMAEYLDRLLDIYRAAIDDFRQAPPTPQETSCALAAHFQKWAPRIGREWPWMVERETLLRQIEQLQAPAPRLEFDRSYGFGGNQMQEWCSHASGFGRGEPPGVWTIAATARLRLGAPAGCLDRLVLTMSLRPFLPASRPELNVDVSVAGLHCARWNFTKPGRLDRKIVVPSEAIGPDGEIWLRLDIDDPRSPAECGTSRDTRALGIMLHTLTMHRGERDGSAKPATPAAPS